MAARRALPFPPRRPNRACPRLVDQMTRNLRVTKWLCPVPAVGVCSDSTGCVQIAGASLGILLRRLGQLVSCFFDPSLGEFPNTGIRAAIAGFFEPSDVLLDPVDLRRGEHRPV